MSGERGERTGRAVVAGGVILVAIWLLRPPAQPPQQITIQAPTPQVVTVEVPAAAPGTVPAPETTAPPVVASETVPAPVVEAAPAPVADPTRDAWRAAAEANGLPTDDDAYRSWLDAMASGGGSAEQSASGGTVTVRPGDSLEEIAERHGVSVSELAAANGINDPNQIEVGWVLVLPGAGSQDVDGPAPRSAPPATQAETSTSSAPAPAPAPAPAETAAPAPPATPNTSGSGSAPRSSSTTAPRPATTQPAPATTSPRTVCQGTGLAPLPGGSCLPPSTSPPAQKRCPAGSIKEWVLVTQPCIPAPRPTTTVERRV